jgi:hypothetical protein
MNIETMAYEYMDEEALQAHASREGIPVISPVSAGAHRRMGCHGPLALAMMGWRIRRCEGHGSVACHTAHGLPRYARNDD